MKKLFLLLLLFVITLPIGAHQLEMNVPVTTSSTEVVDSVSLGTNATGQADNDTKAKPATNKKKRVLTEEEKSTWKSKDEIAQVLTCSTYPDAVFNRSGVPCGVFVIKTEDVDERLPEFKQFAQEQKIKIILKRI